MIVLCDVNFTFVVDVTFGAGAIYYGVDEPLLWHVTVPTSFAAPITPLVVHRNKSYSSCDRST